MILGPGARLSKVPVIDGPVNLRGLLSGPKLCFSKHTSTFPVLTGPEKIVGRYQTLARALHGRPLEKENELELYFIRIIHFVRADCFFFLHFDSKDNGTRSKFNFEVVIVSKESNQSS